MIKRDRYDMGDHNAICDISGQKYKRSQMRYNWKGQLVGPKQYEVKHPQLILHPRVEKIAVDDARTEQEIVFFVPNAEDL